MEKEERKERKILTENRLTTVNKRETSFEGLAAQFENGEDGIYALINESKTTIFQPKVTITKKDLKEIPLLKQLRDTINDWEKETKQAKGKDAYTMRKALIEMRKDQYIIKNAYRKPISFNSVPHTTIAPSLEDSYNLNSEEYVIPAGFSLCDPKICSAILCNYSRLKESAEGNFDSDLWYLLESFDQVSGEALRPYPLYEELVVAKIDGLQNTQIQSLLLEKFGSTHSVEYISSLWRRKIPKLIASAAEDEFLDWYYLNIEKGKYKRCSRCGKVKLAHNKYFSKNNTSKDGFYSICKECRNNPVKKG